MFVIYFSNVYFLLFQKVRKVINEKQYQGNSKINPVEHAILKHFSRLHTYLQHLQNKMMEYFMATHKSSLDTLQNFCEDLERNEKELSSVINIGNLINNPEHLEKVIVKEITKKLTDIMNAPCLLQGKKTEFDALE